LVKAIIGGCLALVLAGWHAQRIEACQPAWLDDTEMRLYPSGRLLECLSLGQPTLLADIAWLQAIQYYGKHRMGDRRYPLAEHLFDVITQIDPEFRSAYIFGALVLEEESRSLDRSRTLFARGMRANPDDWMIAFHRGFLEYLRGDASAGAVQMLQASRVPGAPRYAARLAAHACGQTGRREMAIEIWEEIARLSDDPPMRRLAEQRLHDLRTEGKQAMTAEDPR
jgi:tetratricopeptide (TPR) repeat protein